MADTNSSQLTRFGKRQFLNEPVTEPWASQTWTLFANPWIPSNPSIRGRVLHSAAGDRERPRMKTGLTDFRLPCFLVLLSSGVQVPRRFFSDARWRKRI